MEAARYTAGEAPGARKERGEGEEKDETGDTKFWVLIKVLFLSKWSEINSKLIYYGMRRRFCGMFEMYYAYSMTCNDALKGVWFCISSSLFDDFRGLFLFQSCFSIASLGLKAISCQFLKDSLLVNAQYFQLKCHILLLREESKTKKHTCTCFNYTLLSTINSSSTLGTTSWNVTMQLALECEERHWLYRNQYLPVVLLLHFWHNESSIEW